VSFTDRTQAHRHSQLPGFQTALVGMHHRRRIAQRGRLGGVLGGETGAQDESASRAEPSRIVQMGGDGGGVSGQQLRVVVVPRPELLDQPGRPLLDLGFAERKDPIDDGGCSGTALVLLLAGHEQVGNHPRGVGVQLDRHAVCQRRHHRSSRTARACCAVDSIAKVDSAPWLRFRPSGSRPS
jgi:hypothetical protein